MEILITTSSAGSFGGNTLYCLAGDWLQSRLNSYGSALDEIDLEVCFRHGPLNHPSLKPLYDRYHAEFLPTLPKATLFRKKKKFSLQYETKVVDASWLSKFGRLDLAVFRSVLSEFAEQLHQLDRKLKKSDDFDQDRFHVDVAAAVAAAPQSEEELQALNARLQADRAARHAALGPWEKLDIDWEEYHPAARRLLDDPFLWSCVEDFSPHGNDTGADLLSEFKIWNRRNRHQPAWRMAAKLLDEWDMSSIEPSLVDPIEVARLYAAGDMSLGETDEAMIGAAFAAIKYRGHCDAETIAVGLAAVVRQRVVADIIKREGRDTAEWESSLDLLERYLRGFPTEPVAESTV